mmetsp:Transcript_13252/g.31362  ORF Transcript_13252/g.31362 Transcript_13252/m.31362 type:complete len:314 (-) Transcript_13252:160-1101(-)
MSLSLTKRGQGPRPVATASDSLATKMVVSALGGMGAATFCHPIDVLRIQMQLYQFKGTADALKQIVSKNGPMALYNGVTAAYLRQWTYGSCRMGLYSFFLQKVNASKQPGTEVSFLMKLGMGCTSGAIGSFVGNPAELAMVRMSADSRAPLAEQRNYKNVFECIVRVAREEGVAALWTGATPTVIRAMLLSSTTLAVYSEIKAALPSYVPMLKGNDLGIMFCGTMVCSLVANVICTPFDVVKSRVQNMPAPVKGQPPLYTGMVDCFVKGVKAEGPMVLYRGFTPAFIKLAPYTCISFILTEKMMKAVTGKAAF